MNLLIRRVPATASMFIKIECLLKRALYLPALDIRRDQFDDPVYDYLWDILFEDTRPLL